ncbi:hypothetical protein TVAG_146040 [Trichomonas vaginalis G3]|uniref:Uncharacterized protein n=1 Tax=Trichomonas vaginalis (strain ATCC PRA-98 / G3) TaxID=412133 RepID=A2F8A7_TRIV3|nr:hypothetical protein TVAGG3_0038600 [Trichomonas vaginalis G3]EAX98867.1 hypothetical protein TVAG_146040 [Trichomonas vaginalis G3]KAI5540555.1 hypothetical protein TVAGG3_0038600 [Trichomonas vaginalis G3]|eukprot:XP_001311797.1 hypothetical protein [Trichomonas vaginalis G3]
MFANNSLMNLVSTASIPLLFLPLLYTKPEFDVDQLFTIVYFNVLADVPKRSLISTVTAAYLATGSYQVMFFTFIFGIAVKSLIGKINSVLSYNCVDLLVRFCISNDVNQADFVILHNENPNATALGQQQGEGDNQNLDQLGDEITDITGLNLDVNIEIEMNRGRQTETTDVQEPEIPENDNIPQNQENQENNTTNLNEEEEYEEEEDQVGVINMNNAGTVQDFNKLNSQLKESVIILVSLSVISGLMLKFQNNRMKHITYMLLQFYFAPFLQAHKIFLMFYHDKVFYLWRHVFLDLLLSIITHFASGATINFFLIFPVFFSPIMPNISINKAELDKLVNNQNNQ